MNAQPLNAQMVSGFDPMQTDRASQLQQPSLPLAPVGAKAVALDFDGGRLSSDAGLVLLKDIDEQLGLTRHLARIIHQPKKSTKEGTLGSRMMLKTAVSQEHHHPKTSASGCAGPVQIGLIVTIRHHASWQPPQAYNKLFARRPSTLSTTLHRTC